MNKYTVITERGTQCLVTGDAIIYKTTESGVEFQCIVELDEYNFIEKLRTPITSTIITNEIKNGNAGSN